tara:strand:- start:97 stop:612 length:516 start_codon:yes stop_codon:yes gene_type:complete
MSLPSDNWIGTVMESLDGNVTGVIAQGLAASPNPTLGWIGSLNSIENPQGYWVVVSSPDTITINTSEYPGSVNPIYYLGAGANLISFPYEGPFQISDVIPDEVEPYIDRIVAEGQAATQNPNLGWVGSLNSLEGSRGYWFITTEPIEFQFINPSEIRKQKKNKLNKINVGK